MSKQAHQNQGSRGQRLLISLPALDEEATIARVIDGIPDRFEGVDEVEVLVVDDGSRDRTRELAKEAGARVITHHQNHGVGRAFQSALAVAISENFDLLIMIDADGQFDPAHLPSLVRPVVAGEAGFATASRFLDPALVPKMPWIKRWGNRRMSRLVSRLTKEEYHDVSCGCRCYSRDAMLHLNLMGDFTYTQEVFLNLSFKGIRITEVPTPVRGVREHGKSRVAGSLWSYTWRSGWILFKAYRDYCPMRFFFFLAALCFLPAIGLGGFLGVHYLSTGNFSPHKWAGFSSGFLFLLGTVLVLMGVVGDMLTRHRHYLEELLYRQRLAEQSERNRSVSGADLD